MSDRLKLKNNEKHETDPWLTLTYNTLGKMNFQSF